MILWHIWNSKVWTLSILKMQWKPFSAMETIGISSLLRTIGESEIQVLIFPKFLRKLGDLSKMLPFQPKWIGDKWKGNIIVVFVLFSAALGLKNHLEITECLNYSGLSLASIFSFFFFFWWFYKNKTDSEEQYENNQILTEKEKQHKEHGMKY